MNSKLKSKEADEDEFHIFIILFIDFQTITILT